MQDIIAWLVADGRGYPVIFLLLLGAGLGIPIPEDVPLLATGVLATHQSGLSVAQGAAACAVFVLTRDFVVYGLGRRYGTALLRRPGFSRIAPEAVVNRYQAIIRRRAILVVFCGRFVVGLRSAIFFAAGTAGVSARLFLLVDTLAALISIPFFVWLGWRFASDLHRVEAITKDLRGLSLLVVGLAVIAWGVKVVKGRFDAAADRASAEESARRGEGAESAQSEVPGDGRPSS